MSFQLVFVICDIFSCFDLHLIQSVYTLKDSIASIVNSIVARTSQNVTLSTMFSQEAGYFLYNLCGSLNISCQKHYISGIQTFNFIPIYGLYSIIFVISVISVSFLTFEMTKYLNSTCLHQFHSQYSSKIYR